MGVDSCVGNYGHHHLCAHMLRHMIKSRPPVLMVGRVSVSACSAVNGDISLYEHNNECSLCGAVFCPAGWMCALWGLHPLELCSPPTADSHRASLSCICGKDRSMSLTDDTNQINSHWSMAMSNTHGLVQRFSISSDDVLLMFLCCNLYSVVQSTMKKWWLFFVQIFTNCITRF